MGIGRRDSRKGIVGPSSGAVGDFCAPFAEILPFMCFSGSWKERVVQSSRSGERSRLEGVPAHRSNSGLGPQGLTVLSPLCTLTVTNPITELVNHMPENARRRGKQKMCVCELLQKFRNRPHPQN